MPTLKLSLCFVPRGLSTKVGVWEDTPQLQGEMISLQATGNDPSPDKESKKIETAWKQVAVGASMQWRIACLVGLPSMYDSKTGRRLSR